MATHRPNGNRSPLKFHALLGIYGAIKSLEARHRPVTAENVVKSLRHLAFAASPSLADISGALPQIQQWRTCKEVVSLLDNRCQLHQLEVYLRQRQQALARDMADVRVGIEKLDRLLDQKGLAGNAAGAALQ